ncbi:MAG: alpha/beta fold hydrolase, partial [Bacteroidota bacterium]|nr:alpha/beta fold hydrolase [Bacteroidota bacterium]
MEIKFRDGSTNKISIYNASNKAAPIIVCLPAMGVRARYFEPLAEALNKSGFHAITVEWSGLGNSSLRASRQVDFGLSDHVEDLKEVMDIINKIFPDHQKILLGHSLGG